MKRYDVYRITSPEYEESWFSGGQVVVYETYEDPQAAEERARQLNAARDASDRKFVSFEVRDKERAVRFYVCHVPSIYDEDRWTGMDMACEARGYGTREEAEMRARELDADGGATDAESGTYVVWPRLV